MRKLLIVVLVLAFASPVDAARRWFVQTSDNKIVSFTDDDNAPTPAGTIAVADAVIRTEDPPGATGDITPLGTWDGTTYTPPSGPGLFIPYDTSTESGALKAASLTLHLQLVAWAEALAEVQAFWPQAAVHLGHNLLAYGHRGIRGVVMSDEWTHAQKLTFLEQMAFGAADVTNPGEYFELIEETGIGGQDGVPEPTAQDDPRVLWVNPDTGLRVNLAQWFSGAIEAEGPGVGDTVLSRMAAETTSLTDYIGGAWIEDIP